MDRVSRRGFVGGALAAGAGLGLVTAEAAGRSVLEHGAAGDGETDDTDAFQRAVDAGEGGVPLPKGMYRLTRPVKIDLARCGNASLLGTGEARVVMAGPGPAFHLIGTHAGTASPRTVSDEVRDRQRMPMLSGFEIRGAHDESIGLRLEGTMQATLTGLLASRCRIGFQFVHRNRNLIISHCHVYHNREIGIDFDHVDLHQLIIANSHISYNAAAGIRVLGGQMRNVQIVGNDIEYNHDPEREDCADVLIDTRPPNSAFREGTIASNTIQARPSPGGANVRLLGGQHLHSGGMLAITGNLIGSQTDNIHLADCRMVTVSGNAIYSAMDRSIRMERCAACTIGNNTIDWNPNHRAKEMVDGIVISDCKGISVTGTIIENSLQAGAGVIDVRRSSDVAISHCQVLDPQAKGITLSDVNRCRVSGCSVIDRRGRPTMTASIEVTGESRDNLITDNMVSARSLAIGERTATVRDNVEIGGDAS